MPERLISGIGAAAGANIGKLFEEAKKLYDPKGEFMAGTEAAISRGSKRAVASGVQQLASAGLAGTSIVGGLGKKYEEEVGMPTRARATTQRLGALAGLLQAEAGTEFQMSLRPPTPPVTIGGGYGGGGRRAYAPSVRRTPQATAQPRAVAPARPQPQQPQQQPRPTLNFPKKLAPAGQWLATIGGTGFYATGEGGFTQRQVGPLSGPGAPARKLQTYGPPAPTPKRPLSQYYDVGGELSI